jgi:hypothetical protein
LPLPKAGGTKNLATTLLRVYSLPTLSPQPNTSPAHEMIISVKSDSRLVRGHLSTTRLSLQLANAADLVHDRVQEDHRKDRVEYAAPNFPNLVSTAVDDLEIRSGTAI